MKIYLWGIGKLGTRELETTFANVNITGLIDSNYPSDMYKGMPVYRPEIVVRKNDYDLVVVAIWDSLEVYKYAISLGFDMQRFLFLYRNYTFNDINFIYFNI